MTHRSIDESGPELKVAPLNRRGNLPIGTFDVDEAFNQLPGDDGYDRNSRNVEDQDPARR